MSALDQLISFLEFETLVLEVGVRPSTLLDVLEDSATRVKGLGALKTVKGVADVA